VETASSEPAPLRSARTGYSTMLMSATRRGDVAIMGLLEIVGRETRGAERAVHFELHA